VRVHKQPYRSRPRPDVTSRSNLGTLSRPILGEINQGNGARLGAA
jgi:hypothetical protein